MTQDNQSAEQPRKTGADVAHFFRALGRAGADGMPMPMEVNTAPEYSQVTLRFEEDEIGAVDAWMTWLDGKAVHDHHTYSAGFDRPWHGYGNDYKGGVRPKWLGWDVKVWCSVETPAPSQKPESIAAPDAYAADEPDDLSVAAGIADHYDASAEDGEYVCACGVEFLGEPYLVRHIAEGNAASIEDAPPRGTDAAEVHKPVPAGVEGHAVNGRHHDEPELEQIRSPEVSGRWAGASDAERIALMDAARADAAEEDAQREGAGA